jgi:uroporphyrin-III C-methyltransferase/precorrin-2 dehydrogenase/sirohydrochlorin ferrochelatase
MSTLLFPAFLRLAGRKVLLVGGGGVASSKLRGLLDAGASVTVVAPTVTPDIERAGVPIARRAFEPEDLDAVWFIVAAATAGVNRQVAAAADARQIFVNAVDDPPNATAYLGGVVRRGGVTFAISTEGRAPALSGLLREGLEALLPETELERWMGQAEALRPAWRTEGVPMERRRPQLLDALNRRYDRDG